MNWTMLVGLGAGTLTTLAILPQVIKTWRSKSSADLSLGMFGMMCSGVVLWLIYGLLINDLPIILTNTVALTLQLTVLTLMLKQRRRSEAAHEA